MYLSSNRIREVLNYGREGSRVENHLNNEFSELFQIE